MIQNTNLFSAETNLLFSPDSSEKYFSKAQDVNIADEHSHFSFIYDVIKENSTVLDVGCSYGHFGEVLVKQKKCKVYGIDINEEALNFVKNQGYYSDVFLIDLDEPEKFKSELYRFEKLEKLFDFIICSDILEHLKKPSDAITFVADKLKFCGQVIISIPNISNIDIILNLLEGRFNYSEYGILDNTHLRFFTKRSFGEWIFSINNSYPNLDFQFDLQHIGSTQRISQYVNDIKEKYPMVYYFISNNISDFDVLQHIFRLTKINKTDIPYALKNFLSTGSDDIFEKIYAFDAYSYMHNLEILVDNLKDTMKEKNALIERLEERDSILTSIFNSRGWKVLSIYYRTKEKSLYYYHKIRDKLLSKSNLLRLAAKVIVSSILRSGYVSRKLNWTNLKKVAKNYRQHGFAIVREKIEQKLREGIITSPIMIRCDNAVIISNILEVSGWAISKTNIDRIEVYCDSVYMGSALYGQPRHDVHEIFFPVKNSMNSGFSFYSSLPETISPQDIHSISIRAVTIDGQSSEVMQSIDGKVYKNFLSRTNPTDGTFLWQRDIYKNLLVRPLIAIVLKTTKSTHSLLYATLNSIKAQTYPMWNIVFISEEDMSEKVSTELKQLISDKKLEVYPSREMNKVLSDMNCDFLCFLNAGDLLMPNVFFEMAKKVNMDKNLDLIYVDEDILLNGQRQNPFFKPDWSQDLFLSMNYIGEFFFLRKELFDKLKDMPYGYSPEGMYDLLLRVTELTQNIGHIPLILYTKGNNIDRSSDIEKRIIEEALNRRGISGEVILLDRRYTYRVKRKIIGNPKVSIIIPTAYSNPDFIRRCLISIVDRSTYENFEIILADNSKGKLPSNEIKKMAARVKLRIIEYKGRFNYSLINNMAVKEAEGDYFIFLNDDTAIISPDWIEAMLEHAQQSDVGVVGTKLFYCNEGVQHGGIFLVDYGGGARHAFRFFPKNSSGYYGFLEVIRNCSAVTFACVMVSGRVFHKIGGLDERLRVECNDVDFCLRALKAGYRTVWTPFATLYHKELTTRGPANVLDDVYQFWDRWRSLLEKGDPYYNANLTLDSDNFSLNKRPVLIEHHEPNFLSEYRLDAYQGNVISPGTIKKILIVKLDHIGDLILSLPAIRLLKQKFPQARITMLVGSWAEAIATKITDIDEILTFNFFDEKSEKGVRQFGKNELELLQKRLRSNHFDMAIDLRKNPETRDVLRMSGARHTVGFGTESDYNWLSVRVKLNDVINNTPGKKNKPHITFQLCKLIDAIPLDYSVTSEHGKIEIPELKFEDNLSGRYARLKDVGFLVGIHPGVGNSIKQWPLPYFARLIDIIAERCKLNTKIIILGGKTDRKAANEIFSHVKSKDNVISIAGETSLNEFIEIVKKCDLFIGNDSGPCHIAGFLGVPTLTIFSGHVSPYEWHPLGQKSLTIRVDLPCSPCYLAGPEQCSYNLKCLKSLWPEKVWEAVNQLMAISGNSVL